MKRIPRKPVRQFALTDEGVRSRPLPVQWLDRGNWCLPSGQALVDFALQSGFLAPLLLPNQYGAKPPHSCPATPPQILKEPR